MKTVKSPVYTILALALVMVFVLAACAPAATQAPAEEPAAEEPAAEAPAAEGGWCSGTKIVFFPGGSPGGGFETVVYNGAVQAAADTGADVEYVWSDWDPAKMTTQFTEAVATNPDGIAIMGHPGDAAFDPLIDDAEFEGHSRHQHEHAIAGSASQLQLQRFRLCRCHPLRCWPRRGHGSREAVRRAGGRQGLRLGVAGAGWPR